MKYTVTPNNIPDFMSLHGALPNFRRMPEDIAAKVSPNVADLVKCLAGARLRFKTNSRFIRVEADFREGNVNCAADVLCDGVLVGRVGPFGYDEGEADHIDGTLSLSSDGEMHNVTLFFSRTVETLSLSVTLMDGADVAPADPYPITTPIVYYGSSITMGAMATSPSEAYTALVSERLGVDHINLGFGGSALGETAMAQYIASLDMSAFVLDYEHNAPTLDHLRATHKPFFDIIRRSHPTLPILIVSRPDTDEDPLRVYGGRRIIMDTFHAALDAGDNMVDFVDGSFLWGNEDREKCHMENDPHPTSLGFARTADVITPRLKKLMDRSPSITSTEEDGRDEQYQRRL